MRPAGPHAVGALRAAIAAVGVFALLAASAEAGARVPTIATLRDFPRLATPGASPLTVDRVATLRSAFLREVLGDAGPLLLGSPESPVTAPAADRPTAVTRADTTTPGTSTTTTTPRNGNGSGLLPALPTEADLAVSLLADRSTAKPGDLIAYSMVVTNEGGRPFIGEVRLESHHPFGTHDATCEVQEDDNVCVPFPTPGMPSDAVHTVTVGVVFGPPGLAPGESHRQRFAVRVNPTTQPGTELANHTHLTFVGSADPPRTSNTVVTVVV